MEATQTGMVGNTWSMGELKEVLEETFSTAFETNYRNKVIAVSDSDGGKVLDGQGLKDWLRATVKQELKSYGTDRDSFIEPIMNDGAIVGGLLYSWDALSSTIYLGQLFVHPDFERQGLASSLLDERLPAKHPGLLRYEALHRCGNDKGRKFFQEKHGFRLDWGLVAKYGYSSDFYVGVSKDLE